MLDNSSTTSGDPMLWLILAIAAATIVAMIALRATARRKESDDPLSGLFQAANFDRAAGSSHHGDIAPPKVQRTSVLSGRLDHLGPAGMIWGQDTRDAAIEQVAQIMRAGVRKSDGFEGDREEGFTIVADGASEQEAGGIAKRLMERLAEMPMPGIDESIRLTASFGVAERLDGESYSDLRARADNARDCAQNSAIGSGEDRIVAASEWEEIRLLPAPAPAAKDERDVA